MRYIYPALFILIFFLISVAVGCAPNKPRDWRDTTYTGRQHAALMQDINACNYDMARLRAVATPIPGIGAYGTAFAGPGPRVFYTCMASLGWKNVK